MTPEEQDKLREFIQTAAAAALEAPPAEREQFLESLQHNLHENFRGTGVDDETAARVADLVTDQVRQVVGASE